MNGKLRHKTVAVAVLYDQQHRFLLWNNPRWGGYAFPMKHFEPGDDPQQAALSALDPREFPMTLEGVSVEPLECTGTVGTSDAVREETYYDYYVFGAQLASPFNMDKADPNLRLFSYEDLQAATNVTWPTKAIARSLVEFQEAVTVVVHRECNGNAEFLLIYNRNYHYFFPTIRYKTDASVEEIASQAIQLATGYDGDVQTEYCGEVSNMHESTRFGKRERHFRFYLCRATFPSLDLCESNNELEDSLQRMQSTMGREDESSGECGYWVWFTAEEMKQRADMSPDVEWLLAKVIQIAEGND